MKNAYTTSSYIIQTHEHTYTNTTTHHDTIDIIIIIINIWSYNNVFFGREAVIQTFSSFREEGKRNIVCSCTRRRRGRIPATCEDMYYMGLNQHWTCVFPFVSSCLLMLGLCMDMGRNAHLRAGKRGWYTGQHWLWEYQSLAFCICIWHG